MSNRLDPNDIIGNKYGRLSVIECAYLDKKQHRYYYKCKCSCTDNKYINVRRDHLLSGATISCGCLRRENASKFAAKHNMRSTKFYGKWRSIKSRCNNPSNNRYLNYGGRGIKVCDRWNNSFENFKEDMYESYLEHVAIYGEDDTTIDRIDVNDNYCKENCRWATREEQNINKTNTRYAIYNGINTPLKDIYDNNCMYKEYIQYRLFSNRVIESGWSVDRALTELPKRYNTNNNFIINEVQSIQQHKLLIKPIHFIDNSEKDIINTSNIISFNSLSSFIINENGDIIKLKNN